MPILTLQSIVAAVHTTCFHIRNSFILATNRFYGFSIGGLRLSMRCNWEHRSSGVNCGPSCFGWSKFWDHVVVGLCTIEPWRWGHCAVSKRWVTNALWRSAILHNDGVSYNSHKQCINSVNQLAMLIQTCCAPCDVGTKVAKKKNKINKLRHLSVRPHVTEEPVNGFSWHVFLRSFTHICVLLPTWVKIELH